MNRTLFVCHHGLTLDLSSLEDLFTTVGDVESTRLEANPLVGVIEMSTEQQALDCIERFHGHLVNGHTLTVNLEPPKSSNDQLVSRMKQKKGPN